MQTILRNFIPSNFRVWIACVILLITSISSFGQVAENDHDLKISVENAIKLFPKGRAAAFETLSALGSSTFPFLLEIAADDNYSPYGRVFKRSQLNPFLLSVIASNSDPKSEQALIGLIKSPDNLMKGMAMQSLGRKKSQAAVACVVEYLNDDSTFLFNRITDQGPDADVLEEPIAIRDVAIETLEEITGRILKHSEDNKTKVKAWLKWSKKQTFKEGCKDLN